MRDRIRVIYGFALGAPCILGGAGCGAPETPISIAVPHSAPPPAVATPTEVRPGISDLEPGATLPTADGQSIYLPLCSRLPGAEGVQPAPISGLVCIRNLDEAKSIIVTVARHRDADGRPIRDFLKTPARLAPRATLEIVVKDDEIRGGFSSSVLIEWVADRPVSDPLIEAILFGSAQGRGFAFSERGLVLSDRTRPEGSPPR